jgi:hypothetical protein
MSRVVESEMSSSKPLAPDTGSYWLGFEIKALYVPLGSSRPAPTALA